jgi:hypothetical protein
VIGWTIAFLILVKYIFDIEKIGFQRLDVPQQLEKRYKIDRNFPLKASFFKSLWELLTHLRRFSERKIDV